MASDPGDLVCPNYTSAEHATLRLELISDTVDDAAAAALLSRVWKVNNNAAKLTWQRQIKDVARQATDELRLRAEIEADRIAALKKAQAEDEEEALKKNWAKHVVIPNRPPPLHPSIIPSTYALCKLLKGEYLELHYFTNEGLADSRASASHGDDEAMLPVTDSAGGMSWIPVAAKRTATSFIPDRDLSWEQFSIAMLRMLKAMNNAKWVNQCISMLAVFWAALLNHPYRASALEVEKKCLLVYQAEQRMAWHQAIDTPEGAWDIGIIEPSNQIHTDTAQQRFSHGVCECLSRDNCI